MIVAAVVLFIFGLLFGSFANVCVWRIPRGESIVTPRSHCPACGALISWQRNIPVLSYVFLGGRCGDCRKPISPQYALLEILCGLLFAAQGAVFPVGVALLLGLVLSFGLLVLSVIDFHHQIIPDVFSLGLLAVGLAAAPWNEALGEVWTSRTFLSLTGAALGFTLMFGMAWAGEMIFKREALGGGDIKLMAAMGAFVGWKGVLVGLFIGSLSGTLFAAAMMLRGKMKRGDYLPFGPFLAFGGWAAWTAGQRFSATLLNYYGIPIH